MESTRRWYLEPESFIAVAALIVSVTAVAVGVYEAWLQRTHDRAEVWPHLEVSTWIGDSAVTLRLDNTGIGPGVVHYVDVRVDGQSRRNWEQALTALYGQKPPPHSSATVLEHALRPGDQSTLVQLPTKSVPPAFYPWIGRVRVAVCYSSVFGDSWMVVDTLGRSSTWATMRACPKQDSHADL